MKHAPTSKPHSPNKKQKTVSTGWTVTQVSPGQSSPAQRFAASLLRTDSTTPYRNTTKPYRLLNKPYYVVLYRMSIFKYKPYRQLGSLRAPAAVGRTWCWWGEWYSPSLDQCS